MDLFDKLKILGAAAKYDASCSSSGSRRENSPGGIGNASFSGICHSWSDDGRCISLLKILFANYCIYDCAYCYSRKSNGIERAAFTVDEVVQLTLNFYKRNYIEGLFLSSGVFRSPDHTMGSLVEIIKKLRIEYHFNGYIHVKVIPHAGCELIKEAGLYADRVSANIELPSERSLKLLAPQKNSHEIFNSMSTISDNILESRENKKKYKKAKIFSPAGQSTQLIVGASPENDLSILKLSEGLYQKYRMKRVYYSAYVPVNRDSVLPALITTPPLKREHRLYQADWLLRFYGFKVDEILNPAAPFLDEMIDPKFTWALNNFQFFPVDINRADYEILLRVPGIGVISAKRIITARKFSCLNYEHLGKMGVVLKRVRYFITCGLKQPEGFLNDPEFIRRQVLKENAQSNRKKACELRLF